MSSPPSDKPPEEELRAKRESPERSGASDVDEKPSRIAAWWDRVEPWRRLMLGGAIILVVASTARALMKEDFPDSALFVVNFGGGLLLMLGFAEFFRDRRKK